MAGLIVLFFLMGPVHYFEFEYIRDQQASLHHYYSSHPFKTITIFFIMYILLTGISLPVAGILMIVSGAIFGVLLGTVIASFASAIGSTLAFLTSRYLLSDLIHKRYSDKLETINQGIRTDGILYLFLLRQSSIIPSFMLNILMGLTPISVKGFYLASQAGMLAVTVIFVNAGTQIATISAPAEILSFRVICSFILVGLFPLFAKKAVVYFKRHLTNNHGTTNITAD
jgi:uncharacterized membrane protein YdjX (TVP38/TMEM64 family)